MRLRKYRALGNEYLVVGPLDLDCNRPEAVARQVCNRASGIGADGLLLGPLHSETSDFRLRIFNPDGSEAETSGNGIRIFCRFLYDEGAVDSETPFRLEVIGGQVGCEVLKDGGVVRLQMGTVSFWSDDIGMTGSRREVIREQLAIPGAKFTVCAASIGNPHCVVLDSVTPDEDCQHFGPMIERHPWFRNRTNVQFLTVLDRCNIHLRIWERGAGQTTASGSSSIAAAAVAFRLGLCDAAISVHMPGGILDVSIDEKFSAVLTGPVEFACTVDVFALVEDKEQWRL